MRDLTGAKFGYLTVVSRSPEGPKHGKNRWICECVCGNQVTRYPSKLKDSPNASCGCKQRFRTTVTKKMIEIQPKPRKKAAGSGVIAGAVYRRGFAGWGYVRRFSE